jgi:molecular chaperone IbpA
MRHSTTELLTNMDSLFRDLNRYAIGFEPMFTRISSPNQTAGYPPYNLTQEDNIYRLELAVAGFTDSDIDITLTNDRVLVVRGSRLTGDDGEKQYIHRGIAARDFERQFTLAEHIKVRSAHLDHGMLTIELEREIPEAAKSRKIPIGLGPNVVDVQLTDDKTVAK